MASFIGTMVQNTIQNAASGFITNGVATVGSYAGDGISGVGNLIDRAGEGVGNGIAGKFDGWGGYIRSYGDSVQRATAPNSGSGNYSRDKVQYKKPTEEKKSTEEKKPAQKVAGTKPAGTFYTPYSPPGGNNKKPEQKALPAPSAVAQKKPLTAANLKAFSGPTNGAKKPGAPSVAGTVASKATTKPGGLSGLPNLSSARAPNGKVQTSNQSRPSYKPPAAASKAPSVAPSSAPKYGQTGQANKNVQNGANKGPGGTKGYTPAKTNANGKVMVSKESNPYAATAKSAYKPPASVAGGGKYEGPLKLGGIAGSTAGGSGNKAPEPKKTAPKSEGPQEKSGGPSFF